ncbi:hypothetical protein BDW69DRAFT_198491 [Aspergillus filifer]
MPQQREPKGKPLINLDTHSNKELKRAVLPRTIKGYDSTLVLFDEFLDLHPAACFPLDIRTYKVFLEYYARITRGRIKERPVPETVEHFRRSFEAALSRSRDFIVPESMSITLREFIISELTHLVGLPDAEMSRDGLSPNDLTILLSQLWCRGFKEYRSCYPDRTRVQYTAAILLYCFTSARAGEVHESTARRSASRSKVPRAEDDGDDSDLQAKTMAACYKVKIQQSAPTGHILANIAKHFILTIELVDWIPMLVLTYERNDYGSYTEIMEELETVKRNLLDTPVFRPSSELNCESSTGKAIGADSFGKEFAALGHRSGYAENVTTRACRRWALMETGFEFEEREDVRRLNEELARLDSQMLDAESPDMKKDIILQRRKVRTEKDKIYLSELKRQRELQSATQAGSIHEQTLFHFRQRAMPQRDLLARILPKKTTVRSTEGLEAMKALEALCKESNQVAYRSGLEPLNGKCICGKPIERRISRLNNDKFAEFCFECGQWFNDRKDLDRHCQSHLDNPDQLLRCDPIIFRNCPVKPGYCPFCLGNGRLGPARRMNMKDLVCHLEDVHCCAPCQGQKRSFEEMSGVKEM